MRGDVESADEDDARLHLQDLARDVPVDRRGPAELQPVYADGANDLAKHHQLTHLLHLRRVADAQNSLGWAF